MIERLFQKPHLAGVRLNTLQWSPDGTRLVFLRAAAETDAQDLWLWEPSGREARPLLRVEDLVLGAQVFSRDEELVRERTRQTAAGITRFLWHPAGSSLFIPLNGDVYRYNFADGRVDRLTVNREAEFDLQVSPSGNHLSYVRGGEVYLLDISSGREQRVTHDAGGTIRNGISEFVAQEEMGRTTGVWWSPDGRLLAFLQVDTSPVGVFHIPNFMTPETAVDRQEYPKAGEANAIVRLGILTAAGGEAQWLRYQEQEDDYLARVDWFPDGRRLAVQVQSRDQKVLRLLEIDVETGGQNLLLEERDDYWVSLHNNLRILPDGKRFLWSSERSGYQHLYLYSTDGALIRQVTQGAWDVDRVLHLDTASGTAFFTATEAGPTERHVYAASLEGGRHRRLTSTPGWHDATVAAGGKRFAVVSSRLMEPPRLEVREMPGAGEKFSSQTLHGRSGSWTFRRRSFSRCGTEPARTSMR